VLFDVSNAVLEISVAFCEVDLQLVSQQVFYVGAKVRWKSHLSQQHLKLSVCNN